MKTLAIIPLTLVPLVNIPKATTPLPFETISVSPFYSGKDSTIVLVTKSNHLQFDVILQNDKYSYLKIVSSEIVKPGTYTFKYDNAYSRNKNIIYVSFSTGGAFTSTPKIDRNLFKPSYEYIENNRPIISNETIAVFNGNLTVTTKKLTYNFSGFEGLYVPDYFQKIRLADFKIYLPKANHPFFTCNASLVIKNYNGAFDHISGAGENVTFDLRLVENSDHYTFALANEYYVDNKTLEMFSNGEFIMSLVKTGHIYLPRNEMRNQDKYQCYFMFSDFGLDKDIVVHQFEIRAITNIFGDCSNSKYCIIRE